MDAIGISLSSLRASQARLTASASNIANANVTGALNTASQGAVGASPTDAPSVYQPVGVVQSPLAGGGTYAQIVPNGAGSVWRFVPDSPQADANGLVAAPNVDLAGEMVDAMMARRTFEASVTMIGTVSKLDRETLVRWG